MQADTPIPKTIDEYIAGFPPAVQELLHQLRITIERAAPEAGETISYQMPTFTLHGNLVHFAAYKNHIGFYRFTNAQRDRCNSRSINHSLSI